jgi:hypothetical protein
LFGLAFPAAALFLDLGEEFCGGFVLAQMTGAFVDVAGGVLALLLRVPFGLVSELVRYSAANWLMVLLAPPAFRAASPAKYSLWSSPMSEPDMFWCFTVAMPWRISWRWMLRT